MTGPARGGGVVAGRIEYSPEPRRFQAMLVTVGILVILPGFAAAVLLVIPPQDDAAALMASFIPYGIVADLIALLAFGIAAIRARRRLALAALTGLSALLLILQLIWIAPQFIPDRRPAAGPPITLLSLNLRYGDANLDQVADRAQAADVVVLLEVTPQARSRVVAELGDRFGHQAPASIDTEIESMILSRFPISDVTQIPSPSPDWMATVELPSIGPTRVIAAHPCNPLCGTGRWRQEHQELFQRAVAADAAGPAIIAGDFNATVDHAPIRRLQDHGYATAVDLTGAGWMPTFPADHVLPPLIGIDHVLVNDPLTVLSVHTVRIDNTDHLGLIARMARADRP